MTRQERVDYAKLRALAYVDAGDLQGALASMLSDMRSLTDDTTLGVLMLSASMDGSLDDPAKMRRWVEGFH